MTSETLDSIRRFWKDLSDGPVGQGIFEHTVGPGRRAVQTGLRIQMITNPELFFSLHLPAFVDAIKPLADATNPTGFHERFSSPGGGINGDVSLGVNTFVTGNIFTETIN